MDDLPPGGADVILHDLRSAWLRPEVTFRRVQLEAGRRTDLVIEDGPRGRIVGRIGGPGIEGLLPGHLQVSTTAAGEKEYRNAVAVKEDWTFAMEGVAPGEQLLWVASWRPDHVLAWHQPVSVVEGVTTEVVIEIPGGGIHGRVLDARGRQIPGAQVMLRERRTDGIVPPWHALPCADDGSFRIRGCRTGVYDLAGRADGHGRKVVTVRVPDDSAELEHEFRLQREATLRVRGLVAGEPLTDVTFAFTLGDVQTPPIRRRGLDDEGYAVIAELDAATYHVRATHADHFPGTAVFHGTPGETLTLDVALRRRCALDVRVLDELGRPLVGAPVVVADELSGTDSRTWLAEALVTATPPDGRTDEEGRIRFDGVPEGELNLSTPGALRVVTAQAGVPAAVTLQRLP